MSYKDLSILAKYYEYRGENKKSIYNLLVEFCEKNDPEFNEVIFYKKIRKAVSSTNRSVLRVQNPVKISQLELDFIKGATDYNVQKLLFCLLVVSKYFKTTQTRKNAKINEKYSDKFYVNAKMNDIFKFAKIYLKKSEKDSMVHSMEMLGYIRATMNGSFEILFVDTVSEDHVILVEDLENMISYLPFYCEVCGKTLASRSKRNGKCPECHKKVVMERDRNRQH
jgi:Zn finger protein HypA/HybF involved in hydrogenase expression